MRTGLPGQVKELFSRWLMSYGLSVPDETFSKEKPFSVDQEVLGESIPDIYNGMVETAGWFVVAAATSYGAAISGGAGTVLILSGPLGLIIGGILTCVVALLAVRYGKEKARNYASSWEAPAWLVKRTLTESKIQKARQQFQDQIRQSLNEQCFAICVQFQERINTVAKQQIQALSEITQL